MCNQLFPSKLKVIDCINLFKKHKRYKESVKYINNLYEESYLNNCDFNKLTNLLIILHDNISKEGKK